MRFEGTIKTWNDGRGFGFIEPDQGGQEIFVHVKALPSNAGRPQIGQRVSFEVELNAEGKKRAKNVLPLRVVSSRQAKARLRSRADSPARWGVASLFAIPAFVLLYVTVAMTWHVPIWLPAVYLAASLLCLLVYAIDKSAAVSGRWRVAERTLLMLGLLGGWPGALLAQQLLRHKSSKASFRAAFWGSVWLNVIAFVALNSPLFSVLNS